jgi:hypothetical protein
MLHKCIKNLEIMNILMLSRFCCAGLFITHNTIFSEMPGNKTNYFNGVLCSKRTKANERRGVSRAIKKVLRKTFLIDSFKDNVVILI